MGDSFNRTKESIADKMDLPRDIILDLPKITIMSNSEINIENHKGIVFFRENEIKVNSNMGVISIQGRNFEILFIGGSTITLSGIFKAVVYEENE